MTCRYCQETALEPLRDHFTAGCRSCSARAVAVVGDRPALLTDPLPSDQRQILEHVFGAAWSEQLLEVRRWISAIRQAEVRA